MACQLQDTAKLAFQNFNQIALLVNVAKFLFVSCVATILKGLSRTARQTA